MDAEEISDVITMLDELTSYIVTIVAVNQFGVGPSVTTNVTTPARDTSTSCFCAFIMILIHLSEIVTMDK